MARDPVRVDPEMAFVPTRAPYIDPETESDESCPTLVMLGWAAVMSDPVRDVRLALPDTLIPVKSPTLEMFG